MNTLRCKLLLLAGLGSAMVAFLHIAIMYIGPSAYLYFGAGEKMATMAEANSLYPIILTSGITIVFFAFSLYAFSGAEIIKPLPILKPVLLAIGTIFTLRGLFVVYFIFLLVMTGNAELYKDMVFSVVSLLIGLFYLSGVYLMF